MRKGARLLIFVLTIAIVAAACGNDDSEAEASRTTSVATTASADVAAYLGAVSAAEGEWRAAFERLDQVLSHTYNTRGALFIAVEDAGFTEANATILSRAEDLEPPERYAADHEIWLEYRRTLAQGQEFEAAIASMDLMGLLEQITQGNESVAAFFLDISPGFCGAVVGDDPAFLWRCAPNGPLPGGEYGTQVYEILRGFGLRTGTLFTFPLDMTPEERSERLAVVQPKIEEELQNAGRRIASLEPPAELESDHQALVRYFDEQYQTAVAITEANADGDDAKVLELFADSGVVFNTLLAALSDDISPVVAPLLQEPAA